MILFVEPSAGVTPIVQLIQKAHKEVELNSYFLDSPTILRALKAAHDRGVEVRVIVDHYPYHMSASKVAQEKERITAIGAQFHWAPQRFEKSGHQYRFDHAKYICSGTECEIGTNNYSWASFHRNREYFVITHNPQIVGAAHAVFAADWRSSYAPNWVQKYLVLSPDNSQRDILATIEQPGKVYIESEELGNDRTILDALKKKGSDLYIVLPSTVSAADQKNAASLRAAGVHIAFMNARKRYIHAKMIVGAKQAFIGSENLTWTSLHKNREMGLLLTQPDMLRKLQVQFIHDWKDSTPQPASPSSGGPSLVRTVGGLFHGLFGHRE